MLKCLFLRVHAYVTPLTGYACPCATAKIPGDSLILTVLPKAILCEIGFSAFALQNKSSALNMN